MERRPRQCADPLGVAGDHLAGRLPLGDQRQRDGERALTRLADRGGVRVVLARVHQLQQRGVLGREAHVGPRERRQPLLEAVAGALHRLAHLALQALEAVHGERVEQRLLAGEVPPRGGVADADFTRDLAQRELLHAAAGERTLGALEQRGAEVPVVVGAGRRRHSSRKASARS